LGKILDVRIAPQHASYRPDHQCLVSFHQFLESSGIAARDILHEPHVLKVIVSSARQGSIYARHSWGGIRTRRLSRGSS
jgi:hypothetical protein